MLPNDLKGYEAPTFIGMIPPQVAGRYVAYLLAALMLLDMLGAFK